MKSTELVQSNDVLNLCLEKAWKIKEYIELREKIKANKIDKEFESKFASLYGLNKKSKKFRKKYFELLRKQKLKQEGLSYIIEQLYKIEKTCEFSFATKLIAIINPNKPIYDKYVFKNLNPNSKDKVEQWKKTINNTKEDLSTRVNAAEKLYKEINKEYNSFKHSIEGKKTIKIIRTSLNQKNNKELTDKKIFDLIMWSKR